jgi:ribosomal protein S18
MPRPRESGRERREKAEKFQSFNRPKRMIARAVKRARYMALLPYVSTTG